MSNESRDHLAQFISELEGYIPLSRVWMKKGEYDMGKFAQAVSEQTFRNLPFLKGKEKTWVAENAVPFTVTDVRGPVEKEQLDFAKKRMIRTFTYYLDLLFDDIDHEGIETEMTLSFAANYEGRDRKIEGLREDLQTGIVNTVILTGDQDWYDLGLAG